jgi:protease-4
MIYSAIPIFAYAGQPEALGRLLADINMRGPSVEAVRPTRRELVQNIGGVGLISIRGAMLAGVGPAIADAFGVTDTQHLARQLIAAAGDDRVESVVIRVNSPGGSVEGLTDVADAMAVLTEQKPVAAVIDGMGASAAYYSVAGAHSIYAGRMDLVGSIGTRLMVYDTSGVFEDMGIKAIPIDTGEFKSMGADGVPVTDAHKAEYQRLVDGYFADFRDVVSRGRGLSGERLDAVADGRMWFGSEAGGLGLIDGINTVQNVLNSMQTANAARRRVRSL